MANLKSEVQSNEAVNVARADMKFEIVVIPVSNCFSTMAENTQEALWQRQQ